MTASKPHQHASAWYSRPLPVLEGFESQFTFQISDHSTKCYHVKDQDFGHTHHKSCYVHGGDGLAFVLHRSPDKASALGQSGEELGYGGIPNSLAVEFDTWTNGESQRDASGDIYWDHVAVHSNGRGVNSASDRTRLTVPRRLELADGKKHTIKVAYYPTIKTEYLEAFSVTSGGMDFIKDISEGRRVGTLVVFVDAGIGSDTPLLALPINLAATLRLEHDQAFVVMNV